MAASIQAIKKFCKLFTFEQCPARLCANEKVPPAVARSCSVGG